MLAGPTYNTDYQTLLQELQGDSQDTAESPLVEQSESGESSDTYQQECTGTLLITISMLHSRPVFNILLTT